MKALIVYNPFSGSQKAQKNINFIRAKLSYKYRVVDVFPSQGPKSVTIHIIAYAQNYDMLVVCGGDGTLNEAVNGLMFVAKKPVMAYIPLGTVNDVGNLLGLKKNKINKALDVALNGTEVLMDICKIEDIYFLYGAAAGKFSNISYTTSPKLKKTFGKTAYFIEGIKHLTEENLMNLTVETEDQNISGKYYVMLGLNSQRVAGFRFYRERRIKLNDGIIDVTLFKKKKIVSLFNLALFFLLGDRWKKGITTIRGSRFSIKSLEKIAYTIDGEHAFDSKYATISVQKKAIRVLVSEKIKGKYF